MAELGYDLNPCLYHKDEYARIEEELERLRNNMLDEYEIVKEMGEGSFGLVYSARHKKTQETVAIKHELHGLSPSTVTEIDILKSLPRHPNIVEFKRDAKHGGHVFVVMELMEHDLRRLVRPGRGLPPLEIQYIMKEIIKGVRFLHERGVVHRDLKPANILLRDNNKVIKICNFGLSGRVGCEASAGTRFYTAPEVLEGSCTTNTCAMDMWAVGCIMAELVLGRPLFVGRSDAHQLACIRHLRSGKQPNLGPHTWATELVPWGAHLLERLLAYDPSKRISAKDALNHPWFFPRPTTSMHTQQNSNY